MSDSIYGVTCVLCPFLPWQPKQKLVPLRVPRSADERALAKEMAAKRARATFVANNAIPLMPTTNKSRFEPIKPYNVIKLARPCHDVIVIALQTDLQGWHWH